MNISGKNKDRKEGFQFEGERHWNEIYMINSKLPGHDIIKHSLLQKHWTWLKIPESFCIRDGQVPQNSVERF